MPREVPKDTLGGSPLIPCRDDALSNIACHKLIKAGSEYPTLGLGCQYSATQRVQFLGASQPKLTVTSACNVVIYGFLTLVLRLVNSAFSGHRFPKLCCSFKGVLIFLIIGIKKRMSWSVASVMIRPVGHTLQHIPKRFRRKGPRH